jgi:hypothetical protein
MPSPALIYSASTLRAVVLFCAGQSETLRMEFDGFHTALESSADQRP